MNVFWTPEGKGREASMVQTAIGKTLKELLTECPRVMHKIKALKRKLTKKIVLRNQFFIKKYDSSKLVQGHLECVLHSTFA